MYYNIGLDITSSVLYVSGYAAFVCGIWAPVSLVLVSVLLALFKPIYTVSNKPTTKQI